MLLLAALLLVSEPVRTLDLPEAVEATLVSYARDSQYEYLATPNGLYRTTRLTDPAAPLEVVAFEGRVVNYVAVDSGVLYVMLGHGIFSSSPDPTLLRSFDHGLTFEALDQALRTECFGGNCEYLIGTRIAFHGGAMFVDSGRNVLVTRDAGQTWSVLYGLTADGRPVTQLCPVVFEVIGTQMILGGECPLDVGWISSGTLSADLLSWAVDPLPVNMPDTENRNVQFIRSLGDGEVWAGIEGALLKSVDGGSSFDFKIHYPIDSGVYPYIAELVSSSRDRDLMVIGGFDKGDASPYLAYSANGGETWLDVSEKLPWEHDFANVALIAEDREGQMFLVLQDGGRYTLRTVDAGATPSRRRAVRR